jgi:hypothetical protein
VEIRYTDKLRDSTTYVLTLGTDVKDTRNNRLAEAFSLAFSTGTTIDSAYVTGRVLAAKPEGVMIYAYRLDRINPDTLNPSHALPDYLTQTGNGGLFRLTNLAQGRYRVIALRDQYKNLVYDRQTDEYGVLRGDVTLGEKQGSPEGINFQLTKEDTTPPVLSSARAPDRRHVSLKFSEPMKLGSVHPQDIVIVDTVTQSRLDAIDFSFQSSPMNEGTVVVAPEESLHVYRVRVKGATDLAGNAIVETIEAPSFTASNLPDTLRPQLDFGELADSAKNIRWDDSLKISFTKAVDRRAFESGSSLLDASGARVPVRFVWSGSSLVDILTSHPMSLGAWYTIALVRDSVKDYAGNRQKDTLKNLHFRVIDEKLLGSLKGSVVEKGGKGGGKIRITASEISSKSIPPREIAVDSAGAFEFPYLQEGKYVLTAFHDADGNGRYTFGSVFPFRSSERFAAQPETVKVRARWPVEGILIRID